LAGEQPLVIADPRLDVDDGNSTRRHFDGLPRRRKQGVAGCRQFKAAGAGLGIQKNTAQ